MPYRDARNREFDQLADTLMAPGWDYSDLKNKLAIQWESARDGKTLGECIDACMDEYAMTIATEIGYTKEQKKFALSIELKQRIRRKPASANVAEAPPVKDSCEPPAKESVIK